METIERTTTIPSTRAPVIHTANATTTPATTTSTTTHDSTNTSTIKQLSVRQRKDENYQKMKKYINTSDSLQSKVSTLYPFYIYQPKFYFTLTFMTT